MLLEHSLKQVFKILFLAIDVLSGWLIKKWLEERILHDFRDNLSCFNLVNVLSASFLARVEDLLKLIEHFFTHDHNNFLVQDLFSVFLKRS